MNRRKALITKNLYSVPYNITYNLNGGTLSSPNPSIYTIETSEFDLNSPTRDGYTFLGWTVNDEKEYLTSSKFGWYGDKQYTARWNMNVTEQDVSSNVLNLTIESSNDSDGDGIIDNYNISFVGSSHIEKINLPIKNLIVGQKYTLSFIESNNATNGNSSGYWTAMYGFYIDNIKHTELSTIFKEAAREQGGLIAEWIGTENGYLKVLDGKSLNGSRNITIEFTATSTTMYWIWDFGLIQDGVLYTYNFTNITLTPVVPKIKFDSMALKDDATYVATFNIESYDDYSLKFTFDGESGVELLYYPITGLISGTTYTITFNHKFDGKFINGSGGTYDYGCGILSDITNASLSNKMSSISSNWISNTWTMHSVSNDIETVILTFTATSETVYWVWAMGNVSDSVIATINLNVKKFNATHKNGGSISYL